MAFYTAATVLPRTPDAFKMNATIRFNSWAPWRSSSKTPLTPPLSSTFHSKVLQQQPHVERTTLPPIAHLERSLPPLTPPQDIPPTSREPPPKLSMDVFQSKQPVELSYFVDWLDSTRRSAHSVAEKTCEMICYLWFATSPPERSQPSSNGSPPLFARGSSPSTLQLVATPNFVQFMQKLLETTQVSQSVMVLSLHYIHRLKERNRFTPAQSGSEFRIAVAGLMMANKFLDDNTYTNKTWSEVSGIDLEEINRMEREFLVGVDFNLYVDKSTYESWLNLLKGLIMAKERDSKHFRKSRSLAHQSRLAATPHHPSSTGPATRTYVSSSRQKPPVYRHRARSTSPTSRTLSHPQVSHPQVSHNVSYPEPPPPPPPASAIQYTSQFLSAQNASPTPRSGSKRSAQDAFSPTTASLSQLPSKRPLSMSLHIPECLSSSGTSSHSSSHSPLDGLQSFSKMSLNTSMGGHSPLEASSPWAENGNGISRMAATTARPTIVPETLVTAYMLDEGKKSTAPQALYFYKLASSPLYDASVSEESRPRKALLRYHQPTSSTSSSTSYSYGDMNAPPNGPLYDTEVNGHSTLNQITVAPQTHSYSGAAARFLQQPQVVMMPAVVQSASTSPAMAMGMEDVECGHLPYFHDDVWARPPAAPIVRVSQQLSSQEQQQQQSGRECDRIDTYGYGYDYTTEQQQEDLPMYAAQQPDSQQMDYAPTRHVYPSSPVQETSSASSHSAAPAPYYHRHRQHQHHPAGTASVTVSAQQEQHERVPVPSAPFANAGPPGVGVQFYPTPSQSSTYPPPLVHAYGYTYPHNPRQGGHASWVRMRNGVGY
ncbi:hypothetical protein BYT27DRAFT_7264816 [Phlegmacium glaucopus]|nr:hypothetical protein BYT27DRAFT_7264816 [Phlegmacium glaucopus]